MGKKVYPYKHKTMRTEKGRLITVEYYRQVPFVADILKQMARNGVPEGRVAVVDRQTAPKSSLSRDFFPESIPGIYFGLLLRPTFQVKKSILLTSMATVAAAKAIRRHTDAEIGVRWVNDIFYKKQKMCGVLAEGAVNAEGGFDYVLISLSVNLFPSVFPTTLSDIVSSVFSESYQSLSDQMIFSFLEEFFHMYENFDTDTSFIHDYRGLSILDGKKVKIMDHEEKVSATVIGITNDAHLAVKLKDGTRRVLNSSAELCLEERKKR